MSYKWRYTNTLSFPFLSFPYAKKVTGDSSRRRIHWFFVAPPIQYMLMAELLLTGANSYLSQSCQWFRSLAAAPWLQELHGCWSSALPFLPFVGMSSPATLSIIGSWGWVEWSAHIFVYAGDGHETLKPETEMRRVQVTRRHWDIKIGIRLHVIDCSRTFIFQNHDITLSTWNFRQ